VSRVLRNPGKSKWLGFRSQPTLRKNWLRSDQPATWVTV
jgi:hypothetical protein